MSELNPVFLLGPGRSGTTLLYKMLCLHPKVAFISNYDVKPIARWLARPALWLVPQRPELRRWAWFTAEGKANLEGRSMVQRLVPTPVEGEAVYGGCGLTLEESLLPAQPRVRRRLRKRFLNIQRRHKADLILLKRTANNRRIPTLASAFPEGRYVVIWRDGRAVASSLTQVEWWPNHGIWWANGRTPREMNLDPAEMLELAARNWLEEVAAIERGIATIAPSQLLHVRYEELILSPQEVIQRIANFIDLELSDDYLAEIRKATARRPKSAQARELPESQRLRIEKLIEPTLRRLSYLQEKPIE